MVLWKSLRKAASTPKNDKDMISFDTDESFIQADLETTLSEIQQKFGQSPDLIIRKIRIGNPPSALLSAVYIEGLVDKKMVNELVLSSIVTETGNKTLLKGQAGVFDLIYSIVSAVSEVKVITNWNELMSSVLSGNTVLFMDGSTEAISCSTQGGESRGITEPSTQVVIRGPKDSFNETLGTNISLIRRRIKNSDLWVEKMKIGGLTQTDIAIMYMKGTVNDALVQEVKQRLQRSDIGMVLESGMVEEMIQDQNATLFPTVYNTERPDVIAGNLLEGRVAILVDGTPFALIVPTIFSQFFQSPEDYYNRVDIGIFLRLLRYISFMISMFLPAVYIAATTFHQDMIPTTLLISIAAAREGIPFPAFIEAMLMELTFEILREAGVRMPRTMGQAVSIVGALVLGQAAVQAGIVSTPMVIIVSITGIASFTAPAFNLAIAARLIRLIFMILAASLGFYGVVLGIIVLLAHMSSLYSFGVPYMSPFAPFHLVDQKDAIFHMPDWSVQNRSRLIKQGQTASTEQNSSSESKEGK